MQRAVVTHGGGEYDASTFLRTDGRRAEQQDDLVLGPVS
jgi:hypothetical protein